MIKVVTFQNNNKKDWFPHKTKLFFMHSHICKDRSKNSATFKMELFARIDNDRIYNRVYVAVVTRPSLQAKLKSDENGHVLEAASDKTFLHFFENANFCFNNILFHFENQLQK